MPRLAGEPADLGLEGDAVHRTVENNGRGHAGQPERSGEVVVSSTRGMGERHHSPQRALPRGQDVFGLRPVLINEDETRPIEIELGL